MPDKVLDQQRLNQLDSNIRKMIDLGASQDDVMKYASDFKQKYSSEKPSIPEAPKPATGIPTFAEQQQQLSAYQKTKYEKAMEVDRERNKRLIADVYDSMIKNTPIVPGAGAGKYIAGMIDQAGSALEGVQYIADEAMMYVTGLMSGKLLTAEEKAAQRAILEAQREVGLAPRIAPPKLTPTEYRERIASNMDLTDGIGVDDLKALGFIGSRVAGDIGLAVAAGGAGVPMTATYFTQAYGDGLKEYDNGISKGEFPNNELARQSYAVTLGTVNSILEKYGFDKIFGTGPAFKSIKNRITADLLNNTVKSGGKTTLETLTKAGDDLIRKELKGGLPIAKKAAFAAGVEFATEGGQSALENAAKLMANAIQGQEIFNEDDIKNNFWKNIANDAIAGGILGGGMGSVSMISPDVNNTILNDIAAAKTEEDINNIALELQDAMDKNNIPQQQRELIINNIRRFRDIKQSIPQDLPDNKKSEIISLIDRRYQLDNQITQSKQATSTMDEAFKTDAESDLKILEEGRSLINDQIKEVTSDNKFKYFEQEGKYFKQFGEDTPEEISQSYYNLANIKQQQDAITKSQEPIEEGRTEGGISQRQGTQEGVPQEETTQADTGDSDISGQARQITTVPTFAKVTEENLDDVDKIQGTKVQKKVLKDVKPVVRAISNVVKSITGTGVSVNLHDQKSFADAVKESGGTEQEATSRGFYMASDGSIHLNMDNIDSDTMLHEGFHPILDTLQKFNPSAIDALFAQLESLPSSAPIIQKARDSYEGDVTQKKEAITDFVAGIADGRIVVNPSNFQKLRSFLLDMLKNIGIGSGSPILMNVKNETDLVNLAKFVTEKFTTGEVITVDSLTSLLDGDMQYDSSTGIDVEVDMPDTGSGVKPQFSKDTLEAARNNTKSINELNGTKISRVVFYDITRVGKLEIKNIKTGYTPDVDGKGGPFYSYMDSSLNNKSVLAFVSLNQTIQSLQRQMMYPDAVHAIASQNPLTAHLGNKSTLQALFGQGVGIFQNAANTKAKEKEILGALISEVDRISKTPAVKEANKSVNKILKTVNLKDIKTIDDFRDKILLGEGDSFGSRGSILAEILQNKQSKVTAATRDSHKILHYKYGIPTIADIAQGNNQPELSNVELGDVMKFVKPSTEPVIYTTDRNAYDTYSKKPTPEMKKSGIRIELLPEQDAHESYPFVLVGENVALLDEYVSAAQLFERFKGIKKSQTFFKIGRMKKYAEAGMVQEKVPTEKKGPQFQKKRPVGQVQKKYLSDKMQEYFRFGLLGKENIKLEEKMGGEVAAEVGRAENSISQATALMEKYRTVVSKSDVSKFLTGKMMSTELPDDLADALSSMRGHIDGLTDRLIELGVVNTAVKVDALSWSKKDGKYSFVAKSIEKQEDGTEKEEVLFEYDNLEKERLDEVLGEGISNRIEEDENAEGEIKEKNLVVDYYKANKGSYMLRSYSAVDFKDTPMLELLYGKGLNIDNVTKKLDNVDQTVVDAALGHLAKQAKEDNPELTDEEAMNIAEVQANKYLSKAEENIMQKGLTGSTNVRSLAQRKDIAPELRALMGEYSDPIYNYYATIFKISTLNASRQYLISLKKYGMNKFFFNGPTKEATVMVAAESTEALAPLNGLYTRPEIYEALKNSEEQQRFLAFEIMGRIRKYKTVYNPATHVKNLIGNMGFAVSNGHWNYLPESYEYIKAQIAGGKSKEVIELMDTLNRYGILNTSVGIGELRSYFDRNKSMNDFLQEIYAKGDVVSKGAKVKAQLAKIPRAMEKAYAAEDNMFKVLAFVNESNRYSKVFYGKNYNQLTAQEKKSINEKVSEIVKDTYPTFSRVPKVVKTFSKYMFMGNFLSFPVESIRVSYNTLALAMKEIKSKNPKLATIGATRLAGTVAYNSIFSSLVYYGYNLVGAGFTGLFGYLMRDDEKEKDKANAILKNVVPWSRQNDLYISKFDSGKLDYYDIGSLDSYSYQKKVWNAFWSNVNNKQGFDKAISESMGEALEPWFQIDFTIKNTMNLLSNDDGRGNNIYNPKASPLKKFTDMSVYVGKQMAPGAIGAGIKIADYYQKGEYQKAKDEFYSQMFARKYSTDLEKQFQNYIYAKYSDQNKEVGFINNLRDASDIYRRAKRDGLKGEALENAYQEALTKYKEVLKTANDYYNYAIRGGANPDTLRDMLKRSRIGTYEVKAITKNYYTTKDKEYIPRD